MTAAPSRTMTAAEVAIEPLTRGSPGSDAAASPRTADCNEAQSPEDDMHDGHAG